MAQGCLLSGLGWLHWESGKIMLASAPENILVSRAQPKKKNPTSISTDRPDTLDSSNAYPTSTSSCTRQICPCLELNSAVFSQITDLYPVPAKREDMLVGCRASSFQGVGFGRYNSTMAQRFRRKLPHISSSPFVFLFTQREFREIQLNPVPPKQDAEHCVHSPCCHWQGESSLDPEALASS